MTFRSYWRSSTAASVWVGHKLQELDSGIHYNLCTSVVGMRVRLTVMHVRLSRLSLPSFTANKRIPCDYCWKSFGWEFFCLWMNTWMEAGAARILEILFHKKHVKWIFVFLLHQILRLLLLLLLQCTDHNNSAKGLFAHSNLMYDMKVLIGVIVTLY